MTASASPVPDFTPGPGPAAPLLDTVTVEEFSHRGAFRALAPAWEALVRRAGRHGPFFQPHWFAGESDLSGPGFGQEREAVNDFCQTLDLIQLAFQPAALRARESFVLKRGFQLAKPCHAVWLIGHELPVADAVVLR